MLDDQLTAKFFAYIIRRTDALENLHRGITPSSEAGDYSDVYVVTPYGKIEWNKLSRISDKEMRTLMLEVQKQILGGLTLLHQMKETMTEERVIQVINDLELNWDIPNYKQKK